LRLLDLLSASVLVLLVAMPIMWGRKRANEAIDHWVQPRLGEMSKVETDWMTYPQPPEFVHGNEPALRAFLHGQPLILALQDRLEPRTIWVRQGDVLQRSHESPDAETLSHWFSLAEAARSFLWHPTGGLSDEARPSPKIILRGDRWLVAKRWQEGSPEVETSLQNLLGVGARVRVSLMKDGDEARKDLRPQVWGAEPNLQADPYRGQRAIFMAGVSSDEFPGWSFNVIPFEADAKVIQSGWRIQMLLAAFVSVLVGGAMVLAMYLRSRARREAALDADRMAAMTHSLKTPLAILKFRCDTLRLGRLPPDQLDSQLIQIGEEADRMSGMIEKTLRALQDPDPAGPQELVTPEWIRGLAEDLAPAFEAESRSLLLVCDEQSGKAALSSLRSALLTLIENALYHGSGEVTLETMSARKRFFIKVSDEGAGLSATDLKSLGKPFMRIREPGKEGFRQEGQGLGLSLLCKMAEQEGWGLTFASESGRGLCATLEIQNT
jgi:signal transduction histidine kinase